jgi:hypothetical protein
MCQYSAVAFYVGDAFLKTSHNSRQVLKQIPDSCRLGGGGKFALFQTLRIK